MKETATLNESKTMTSKEFFNLKAVKSMQAIQMTNPYGSAPHKKADEDMRSLLVDNMGEDFANGYWGEY